MSILISILVVLIVLALALYCVRLAPIDGQVSMIIQILLVCIAIVYIASKAGLVS